LHPELAQEKRAKHAAKMEATKEKKAARKKAVASALEYSGEALDSAMGVSYAGQRDSGTCD